MRHNRRGIPMDLKSVEGREVYSTVVLFENNAEQYVSLTSYVVKTKSKGLKNVIWCSTARNILGTEKEGTRHKPGVGKRYDFCKGKLNVLVILG